jgi:cystathionine beta-synthase
VLSDKECFLTARELTRKEGLWTGGSGGGAVCGAIKFAREHPECRNIVIILPDSGSRYLSKVFDDDWLRENSFLGEEAPFGTLGDVVAERRSKLVSAAGSDSFQTVIRLMKKHGISQLPVLDGGKLLGIVSESALLEALLNDPQSVDRPVADCVDQNYVVVPPETPVGKLAPIFAGGKVALIEEGGSIKGVVTRIDLIDHMAGLLG